MAKHNLLVLLLALLVSTSSRIGTTLALEIVGAGFGRTGTDSLREALEILGYRTYHMRVIIENRLDNHTHLWKSYFQGETPVGDIVDELYKKNGFTAAVDFPTAGAWKDLAMFYPEAKIILTERSSPEKWWESASETILVPKLPFRIAFNISPFFGNVRTMIIALWNRVFQLPRTLTHKDGDVAIAAYKKNSKEAREFEDGRRTLAFNVMEGWEPLCSFLGKEIPSVPFPHSNTRQEFHRSTK